MLIHSDSDNMNSIVYHLIIERYSMKTLHWYFPWATALHLYNMTGRGEKLQQLHCYHPFSDSLDIYLTKNHYENYSPKVVPIAKIWGSGSWTIVSDCAQQFPANSNTWHWGKHVVFLIALQVEICFEYNIILDGIGSHWIQFKNLI